VSRLRALGRNVLALSAVSFFTDISSEMIYPLLPLFLTTVLGAGAGAVGLIEGAAESTAALLKLASGWWSDRVHRRKPLVAIGYLLASVTRPLTGIAQSAAQVLAIRLADRTGKGLRTSPRDALIADSVDPKMRGRAFGLHRAADNAGAVVGPLIAFFLLQYGHAELRHVFLWSAVPAALAVGVVLFGVREREAGGGKGKGKAGSDAAHRADRGTPEGPSGSPSAGTAAAASQPLGRPFRTYLVVLLLFTLGNSTDAFLLLRAAQLGIAVALVPVLWAFLSIVKTVSSTPAGTLSDRIGRRPLIVAGWVVYAAVYLAFAAASTAWEGWVLFGVYGIYFGLTEGVEKAYVADLVPASRRGAAYGWYNLAIGLGALPASALFGAIWDRAGAPAAFATGAGFAVLASIGLGTLLRS
jgi:MFS family permease